MIVSAWRQENQEDNDQILRSVCLYRNRLNNLAKDTAVTKSQRNPKTQVACLFTNFILNMLRLGWYLICFS